MTGRPTLRAFVKQLFAAKPEEDRPALHAAAARR
jgi:hypothetical protein